MTRKEARYLVDNVLFDARHNEYSDEQLRDVLADLLFEENQKMKDIIKYAVKKASEFITINIDAQ